jgi:shikimate dehydrogenase
MKQNRPPISGRTRLYGLFADPVEHLQTPAVLSELLDRRGVDAVFMPLHVTAEHLAVTVAGMRHLRNFAGYCVSLSHKPMAARLGDALLPNARACGVVNALFGALGVTVMADIQPTPVGFFGAIRLC